MEQEASVQPLSENEATVLGRWLNPSRLEPVFLSECAEFFRAQPDRVIVVDDILRESLAHDLFRFFSQEAPFYTQYGLFVEGDVDRETWEDADRGERFFRYGVLRDVPGEGPGGGPFLFNEIRDVLRTAEFRRFFEVMTQQPLGGVEKPVAHRMGAQDFLRPHNDRSANRRIAVVLYLTPEWDARWGGSLQIASELGARRIPPVFNRMVVFDVHAHVGHRVEPFTDEAGDRERFSLGWWIQDPDEGCA